MILGLHISDHAIAAAVARDEASRARAARRVSRAVAAVRIVAAAPGDHAAAIGAARAAMHPR